MTDQRRGGSARGDDAPGYRGALPPREDALARPWVLIVLGIFVLMLALSFANVPSTLFPSPTPSPLPSISAAPGASGSAGGSPTASTPASVAASPSAVASPSPTP
jgi:hypothetical protein